jgi:hypothetical protein
LSTLQADRIPSTPTETRFYTANSTLTSPHLYYTGDDPINDHDHEDDEEPIAAWEALLLPDWRWEALDKRDDDLYYGRVKSPKTYGNWEYGHFTQEQLKEAGAYRVDEDIGSNEPLFPDGGYELSDVYETELAALDYREEGDSESDR